MRIHRHLPQRLLLALAATLAFAFAAPASQAAQVGINIGANSGNWFTSQKVIAAVDKAHPAWVRVFMGWYGIEPQRGVYNSGEIASYRHFFASLPAGTKVDVDVVGSPAWANGGSSNTATPPTDPADYARFVNYLANQFRGQVSSWEVWNEEDASAFWTGSTGQYVALLRAAYPAIKSAQPDATVTMGGLTGNDSAYLAAVYAAGGRGSFNAVGIHTDTACNVASPTTFEYNFGTQTINQYFFLGFTAVHDVMAANGDGALPIDMTELGWSSTSAECRTGAWAGKKLAGVAPATQALYLEQAYHCLALPQYSYVRSADWFELFDNGNSSEPLANYGLLTSSYVAKPAYEAFRNESLHGDQMTGGCANFSPPTVQVSSPSPGQRYSGPLLISVTAHDKGSSVREITLEHDGKVIRHFVATSESTSLSGSIAWQGAKSLPLGSHTITVIARDRQGNVATTNVLVVHTTALHAGRRAKLVRGARLIAFSW